MLWYRYGTSTGTGSTIRRGCPLRTGRLGTGFTKGHFQRKFLTSFDQKSRSSLLRMDSTLFLSVDVSTFNYYVVRTIFNRKLKIGIYLYVRTI